MVDIPPGAIEFELQCLIADPARRGRGLGTRLIETAVARTWIDHPCAPGVLVAVLAAYTASWRALQKADRPA